VRKAGWGVREKYWGVPFSQASGSERDQCTTREKFARRAARTPSAVGTARTHTNHACT
jgi:hypothetical protein